MIYFSEFNTNLSNEEYEKAYTSLRDRLPAARREKLDAVKNSKNKYTGALVYALLEYAIKREYSAYTCVPHLLSSAKIAHTSHGKPYFEGSMAEIHFNLSHCANSVVCAIAPYEIGVDVQDVRKMSESLVKRLLPSQVNSTPENTTELWTRLEAISKLLGSGIVTPDFFKLSDEDFLAAHEIKVSTKKVASDYLSVATYVKDWDFDLYEVIIIPAELLSATFSS